MEDASDSADIVLHNSQMFHEKLATPFVTRAFIVAVVAVILTWAARLSGLLPRLDLTDFNVLHIAGQMVWRGDIADAYHLPNLLRVMRELTGQEALLPWAYPPPFNLVMALFAPLPIGLAFLLFIGATLIAFLLVLRRISGLLFPAVILALFPSLMLTIACGQNGFLTGTLIGLTCLGLLKQRGSAGLPLGLMVIKPHLAVGLAAGALVMRRWTCLAAAVGTTLLASGIATLVLGPTIWSAFLRGANEASANLAAGHYPLHRMISVYAWLRSSGVPATLALLAQSAVAVTALGFVLFAVRKRLPQRQIIGIAVMAGLLMSPYAYDYDLPIYGIGLALLLPDLLQRARRHEQALLFGLGWGSSAYGFIIQTLNGGVAGWHPPSPISLSLAGPMLIALLALIWIILRREPARAIAGAPSPQTRASAPVQAA
ncbi:glycosyltransferase family 87 protein [Methylorubrum sp. POS3]|uniref:glycosyltransferase family 87 protein n=1 Tax=Methylorubrum sp. POS3 TaxID=2998492 RepID=UPI00372CD373